VLLSVICINNDYNINNSIVFITSIGNNELKNGMGFVYNKNKGHDYIVTNYHVIHDSKEIYVYNVNGEKITANIVNYDIYSDIALLKIKDTLNLEKVKIGNEYIRLNGTVYYYNVNDRQLDKGIVSNINEDININNDYGNSHYKVNSMIGNIVEGNSGGPVFDEKNQVIGVISLKEKDTDVGYYIDIGNVVDIVTKLENQTLDRPNLGGIFINSFDVEMLNKYNLILEEINGVVVVDVFENYPLFSNGIKKGDIITKINNISITDINELQNNIFLYKKGDIINLEYYRKGFYNNVDIYLNK